MIDTTLQMVTFQLGVENYGINIMDVKEIYSVQEVRDIPNAPPYVEGIFNLRGDIIPVINLHKRFHINKAILTEDEAMLSGFIIINLDGMQLGVIIDKVLRVVSVNMGQIQPPPQMITGIGSEYIQGVIHQDDGYLIILDIRRLFDPEELQNISNVNP
ncbi:chemotaxis protein CheW [Oceanispirochaeta sp.]|jgi:purine-binding chemotaxis protein CheW|uniref:chemotaxis protein CheW n=1 Tax=Oceanispirochaeta sp. TaxID=2035350 RepID=UPI002623E0FD|nr:chemotaxis protein CheW [Oceanispirochaeta sp.]MDA3956228.1 chemotaxis protein CheW [Oceanispirochaeta sp.]